MRIELTEVAKGRNLRALPPTTATFETGTATLVCVETEQRPSVLGLIASGRMAPGAGAVAIDGRADAAAIRRRIALLDAPDVCDPHADIPTVDVVAEELMFAGRRSTPIAARRWLDDLGMSDTAWTPIGNIDPAQRIRILCELAILRPGVEGFVLVSPDRHGGEPGVWWRIAQEFAERGSAVLVIAGRASHSALEATGGFAPLVLAPDAELEPAPEHVPDAELEPAPVSDPASEPAPAPASTDPRPTFGGSAPAEPTESGTRPAEVGTREGAEATPEPARSPEAADAPPPTQAPDPESEEETR